MFLATAILIKVLRLLKLEDFVFIEAKFKYIILRNVLNKASFYNIFQKKWSTRFLVKLKENFSVMHYLKVIISKEAYIILEYLSKPKQKSRNIRRYAIPKTRASKPINLKMLRL